ncbi:MAG: hypothetical protein IPG89_15465 [Bacteroidetes bacterium]|nr:hypothetical protein [Bacteroidota bacterium]
MSVTKILNEDWTEYDNRKIRDSRDAKFFACTESWEVNYLKSKIRKYYPFTPEKTIDDTIKACCQSIDSPHPRKTFVECVAKKLD